MESSRQESWNGLPFPPPEDLPNPETEPESPVSPALAVRFFTAEPPQKPQSIALDRVKGCRLRHSIPWLRVVLMGAGNEISKGKALKGKKT